MVEKYASSAKTNMNDLLLARYLSANRSKRVEFIVSQPLANISLIDMKLQTRMRQTASPSFA